MLHCSKCEQLSSTSASLSVPVCQLAAASARDHSHAIYVCTMFFLFVVQEPPLPQLSMSRCIKVRLLVFHQDRLAPPAAVR